MLCTLELMNVITPNIITTGNNNNMTKEPLDIRILECKNPGYKNPRISEALNDNDNVMYIRTPGNGLEPLNEITPGHNNPWT